MKNYLTKCTLSAVMPLLLSLQLFGGTASAEVPDNEPFASRQFDNKLVIDIIKAQGVPAEAIKSVFTYIDEHKETPQMVTKKHRPQGQKAYLSEEPISLKTQYAAIIDFSRPSTEKRLYLIDLTTGKVEKYYVAHGRNSGMLEPTKFANINMSKKSSLGFVVGGDTYVGIHGKSINLYGLQASNDNVALRDVVMHGADYVSDEFIAKNNRLGVSWGCPAVEEAALPRMVQTLANGSLIYFYHADLMRDARLTPMQQDNISSPHYNDPTVDLPGEEEDFQKK